MEGIESVEPEVHITKCIKDHVDDVLKTQNLKKPLRLELESLRDKKTIPFRLVKEIYEHLRGTGEKVYLHTLLEDSDVHLPTVKLPPRNPELEARIQKLRLEQENREYKEMTRNVDRKQHGGLDLKIGEEVKTMNRQMIAVFNFIVTVLGAFAFGYKATEYSLGPNYFPVQMMAGLVFGTVVFFADLYFLVMYSS